MISIDIQVSRSKGRSKVKPTLHMLGKGGISVLQTDIFSLRGFIFFALQICGGWPDSLSRCAQLINENLQVDFVDLNCGCPIDLVYKRVSTCRFIGCFEDLCGFDITAIL